MYNCALLKSNAKRQYLLTSMLFCGECGAKMHGNLRKSTKGHEYMTYRCNNRINQHTCGKKEIRTEIVDDFVLDEVFKNFFTDKTISKLTDSINKYRNKILMSNERFKSVQAELKFTLVLIDTPGMNSAQTSDDGVNKHAEIALEAVSSDSKPMIILCAETTQYEDESIGEFMKEIISQSKEDGGGFNDRFLFIMNKSDDIRYKSGEETTDVKSDFSKYLTNSDKWSISGDPELEKLAESADDFVPRVFMTAARVAFAIQKGAHKFTEEEINDNEEKYDLNEDLAKFEKRIYKLENKKYYLSRYCDIPNYLKDEIEAEFEKAMEEEDSIRATELQCGIIPLEMAIRDYIEKYAYPVKVRGLLDTFEDILEDVENFSSAALNDIKNAMDHLGEKKDENLT